MAVRFQLRRDTAANWTSANSVLALGEPGVETDTLKVKVGDGSTAWNSLAYSITKDFTDLTSTPTTLAGYGITDALALAGLSVTQNAASGTGAITYNNATGVFSYTPPNFEGLNGNFTGSVFADDSTIMVDGVAGKIVGQLEVSNPFINGTIDSTDSSPITITPDVVMSAGLTIGNHIIPSSSENIDLGSASARFRDLYLSGNSAVIGDLALKRHTSGGLLVSDHSTGNATNLTTHDITANNITTAGYLRGPASFVIDPAAFGDDTGTVVIAGNLQVDGLQTTINSTTVSIDDLNFSIATDAADSAAANGAGITVGGAGATLNYTHATTSWDMNKPLNVTGNIGVTGTVDGVDIAARDAILTSTTTTAGAALPKAGGTMTGDLLIQKAEPIINLRRSDNTLLPGLLWQGSGGAQAASIRMDGDSGSANSLVMSTFNGSSVAERLRILTGAADGIQVTGNVGIGTSSPGHLLDILKSGSGDATINIKSTTGGDPTIIFNSAAANRQGIIKFQDNGTNVGRIDYVHNGDRIDIQAGSATGATMSIENGQVGIGTTSPTGKLHVYSGDAGTVTPSSQADDLVVEASTEGGITIMTPDDQSARIRFTSPSTESGDVGGADIFYRQNINKMSMGTTVSGGKLVFKSGAGVETLFLDGGNVGIGTASPTAQLDIQSNMNASGVFTGSISTTTLTVTAVASGTIAVGDRITDASIEPNTVITALGTGSGGTGTYTVSISQTASSQTLRTTSHTKNLLLFKDTDTTASGGTQIGTIEFEGSDSGNEGTKAFITAVTQSSASPAMLAFGTAPSGVVNAQTRLVITNSGNVGIGTNSPSQIFEVEKAADDKLVYGSNPRLLLDTPTGINGLRVLGDTTPFEFKIDSGTYNGSTFQMGGTGDLSFIGITTTASDTFNDSPTFFFNSQRWNGSANSTHFQGAIKGHTRSITNGDGYLGIGANASANQLNIDASTGNVGIGTTTPGSELSVVNTGDVKVEIKSTGTGDADAILMLDSADGGESEVRFKHDGVLGAKIQWFTDGSPDLNIMTESGTDGVIDFQPNLTLAMRIQPGGTIVTGDHAVFSGTLSSGANTVKITTPQTLSGGNHWDQFTAIFTMTGVDGGLSGNTFTQWRQTWTGLNTWGGGAPAAIIGSAPSVTHATVSADYVQFDIATGYIPGNTMLRVEVLSHAMLNDCIVTIT